jgi:hypothetical protein
VSLVAPKELDPFGATTEATGPDSGVTALTRQFVLTQPRPHTNVHEQTGYTTRRASDLKSWFR